MLDRQRPSRDLSMSPSGSDGNVHRSLYLSSGPSAKVES